MGLKKRRNDSRLKMFYKGLKDAASIPIMALLSTFSQNPLGSYSINASELRGTIRT